jgi:hypothetical protein
MADTVTVQAIEPHSYNGQDYAVGATYEIAADLADSVVAQKKAVRVARAAAATPHAPAARGAYRTTAATATRTTALRAKPKTTKKKKR